MEFNKCIRCGGFHIGSLDTCETCHTKELEEVKMLEGQFSGLKKVSFEDVEKASMLTGISGPRIERYLNKYLNK